MEDLTKADGHPDLIMMGKAGRWEKQFHGLGKGEN